MTLPQFVCGKRHGKHFIPASVLVVEYMNHGRRVQSVVLLNFDAGLRYQEIANLLGIPLGTVRLAAHVDGV
jgi:hypothetical protein